ncbi:hypothetical protein GS399_05940 [Pedobacter sp. HMF7647]|uniref:Signal transduction histidine kinase internal region domain-containing protein n=1 Tax=Hufsiella arboris TaxID=2695275 RepID=A0A7K1Y8Z1_9SPHI|nr:hypothetical protein [Hufsiella arboris]
MNNTIVRHLIFWLAYSIQGTLLEYAWIHSLFGDVKTMNVVFTAILFNFSLLPAKIIFTYLLLDLFLPQLLIKRWKLSIVITEIVGSLILSIIAHRLAGNYYIAPTLYPEKPVLFSDVFDFSRMFVSLLDIGYVAGIALALRLFRMQISHLRNEKDLVREKLETELKFLKNQINPHFLFNTLNNIYGLARKKSDKAPEVVMRLSKLLRFMLYESDRRTMPISDEIRVLEDYVQLEKIRFNDRLNLSFKQNIDDFDQVITPLILLPFIENAFKHGICETTESTQISIDISVKNGHLNFLIQNSHDKEQTQVHEKIGLSNVRRQLELMYREFSLNIENLAGTFNVNLWINLNSHAAI